MNDTTDANIWADDAPATPTKKTKAVAAPAVPKSTSTAEFDLEGLMTDFPTARDLERFVYDETGLVLNLKGRANKLKYQVAMDVLNGEKVDPVFLGKENPYIDKNDMVPVEDIRPAPARDKELPDRSEIQNSFYTPFVPHPNSDYRAKGKKCQAIFRKYKTGAISYEILGPIDQDPQGEKIDKYGRTRPEVIKWIDPRTGEQTVMREDGTLTTIGRRLRSMMQAFKVNNSNAWDVWVDRDFGRMNSEVITNPWDLN